MTINGGDDDAFNFVFNHFGSSSSSSHHGSNVASDSENLEPNIGNSSMPSVNSNNNLVYCSILFL